MGAGGELVVRPGGLDLAFGIELSDVGDAAVGQLPDPRHPFVPWVVVFQVIPLQVLAPLAPVVGGGEDDADIVAGTLAHQQGVARRAARVVDEGGDGRPVGIVEHGPVQRGEDAVEGVEVAHAGLSLRVSGSPCALDASPPGASDGGVVKGGDITTRTSAGAPVNDSPTQGPGGRRRMTGGLRDACVSCPCLPTLYLSYRRDLHFSILST